MPLAAHKCTLEYIAGGFSTANTGMTLVSGTTYRPTIFKNTVFSPVVAVVIKDGGTPLASSAFTVDYLAGQVTLNSAPSGAVTADFSYFNPMPALEVREFSINLVRDELEDTVFGDNDKSFLMGLKGGTGNISGLDVLSTLFLDQSGVQRSIQSVHELEQSFIISVKFDATSQRTFRAFAEIPSLDLSGARDGLVEGSFPFTISQVTGQNTPDRQAYSFFNAIP